MAPCPPAAALLRAFPRTRGCPARPRLSHKACRRHTRISRIPALRTAAMSACRRTPTTTRTPSRRLNGVLSHPHDNTAPEGGGLYPLCPGFPDRDVRMYTTKAPPKRGLTGVDNAARTRDLLNHNQLLYRLSYIHHVCHPVSRIRTTDGYYTGFSRQREFGASRRSRTTGNGVDHPAAHTRNAHRQPRHVLFRSLQPYAMSATKHWVFAARTGWTMCVLPGILKAEAGVMVGWESIRR